MAEGLLLMGGQRRPEEMTFRLTPQIRNQLCRDLEGTAQPEETAHARVLKNKSLLHWRSNRPVCGRQSDDGNRVDSTGEAGGTSLQGAYYPWQKC